MSNSNITIAAFEIPALTRMSTKASKYKFGELVAGSSEAIVELNVADVEKTKSRMTSALGAYRKRTGDKGRFTVRAFPAGNPTNVGCWKLADATVAQADTQVEVQAAE